MERERGEEMSQRSQTCQQSGEPPRAAYDRNSELRSVFEDFELVLRDRNPDFTNLSPFVLLDMGVAGHCEIAYASAEFLKLTGYMGDDIIGQSWFAICGDESDADDMRYLESQIYGGEEGSCCILCYKADGSKFWNNMHVLPGSGDMIFTLLSSFQASDIVQERIDAENARDAHRAQAKLSRQAMGEGEEQELSEHVKQIQTATWVMAALNIVIEATESADDQTSLMTEEEHVLMLQEDERRTKDGMSKLMHHIVSNDYTNLKGSLIGGGMQICTGMCANFTVQFKTDCGEMISINVHDANALHYAICRSSFAAASAILVAAPGLANKKCAWRQTIDHGETGEMSVHSESLTAEELAIRYGTFFNQTDCDVATLYFGFSSVLRQFHQFSYKLPFAMHPSPEIRLENTHDNGRMLLLLLMQHASDAIKQNLFENDDMTAMEPFSGLH